MSNKNRTKGHNLERDVAIMFRAMGYKFAKTSRQASSLLDSCSIDLFGIPYLVQCKSGYDRGLNYQEIFTKMKELLKVNFPPEDAIHSYPRMIFHKRTGRTKEYYQVILPKSDFETMLTKIAYLEELERKVKEHCKNDPKSTLCNILNI